MRNQYLAACCTYTHIHIKYIIDYFIKGLHWSLFFVYIFACFSTHTTFSLFRCVPILYIYFHTRIYIGRLYIGIIHIWQLINETYHMREIKSLPSISTKQHPITHIYHIHTHVYLYIFRICKFHLDCWIVHWMYEFYGLETTRVCLIIVNLKRAYINHIICSCH